MEEKILNNINGFPLDESQKKVVTANDKYVLVSAGAGSGKTLTIIGKIRYLIDIEKLKEDEIICISFTNETTNNLKNKLKENYNYDIPCYTFHKLGLEILQKYNYRIASQDQLSYTIEEYLYGVINTAPNNKKIILDYFKIKYNSKNYEKKYKSISNKNFEYLTKTIERFINLLKSNDLDEHYIIECIKKEKDKRNHKLLIIILYIYINYQKELLANREIDFNDMISLATKKIQKYGYDKNIKYIIIDEFQDTSPIRFNLIKALLQKTKSKLLVVGDDFQSIYRFTGCDLSLFLNFKNIFPKAKILKIENTYRNSQELIDIAGSFIMKNNNQIKKDLKSNKHIKYPIEIIYYKDFLKEFIKLIEKIHTKNKKTILILGRNNYDINLITSNKKFLYEKNTITYKNITMKYLTIHRSKGLEADNVILINLTNKLTGFPNKIENNKVFKHIIKEKDTYPYEEERRLMYVALTRTKNKIYLLVPKSNQSEFIKELKKIGKGKIIIKK